MISVRDCVMNIMDPNRVCYTEDYLYYKYGNLMGSFDWVRKLKGYGLM
jgi:hypothetical protein